MQNMNRNHYKNEKIRELREEAGLTQEQLAARVGAHSVTISRVETGVVCSFDLLCRIAVALGVGWSELMRTTPTQQNNLSNLALGVDLLSIQC